MNHPSSMDHHEEDEEEEDFIDIQVSSSSSSSNLFCYTINSPPKAAIEFEFQMSSAPSERASTTSPADELFYKGKLLPLHLPPRLQMVQKLLQNTTFDTNKTNLSSSSFEDENTTISTLIPFTTTNTPLESCNISPSESCRVSSELNPDEHFFDWSNELSGFISDTNHPKKHWSKKLKLIKQSLITQKLKASRAYLKSIFSKSVCSDKSCSKPASSTIGEQPPTRHHDSMGKKSPLGKTGKVAYYSTLASVMRSTHKEMVEEAAVISHRKSFSGAFKRQSAAATKCCSSSSSSSSSSDASSLSSSFSVNSSGLFELEFFKRSGSGNSEIENSIEGAIAHCKQSQQVFSSISASRIAVSEDKER